MANRDVHEPKLPGVRTLKADAAAEADEAGHLGVSFNTKSKVVPLTTPKPTQPVAGEGKAGDKALFDVGRAIDDDQLEVGSFVTDKRHKKIAFKAVAQAAFKEWWSKTSRTIKKIEAFAPAKEKPTIQKAETRKEIIKEATAHTKLAPRDDHALVIEKIKTLAHDAERVTGKSYTVKKPTVKAESTPTWSQVNAKNPSQTSTPSSASGTEHAPVTNKPAKKPDHLTIAPIVARPEKRTKSDESISHPSPATLPKPKPLAEKATPHDDMTVIRAPRSEPQLIATPAAPYMEQPHKPGLWKILTKKHKGPEHAKVTVAPPIPKPLSRLTLSDSQTTAGSADMKAGEFLALFKKQQSTKPAPTTAAAPTPKKSSAPAPEKVAVASEPQNISRPAHNERPEIKEPPLPQATPQLTEPTQIIPEPAAIPIVDTQPAALVPPTPQPVTPPAAVAIATQPHPEPIPTPALSKAESSEWTAAARGDVSPTVSILKEAIVAQAPTPAAPIISVKTPPRASEKPKPPAPRLVLTGEKPYFEFAPETPSETDTPSANVTRAISATPQKVRPVWTTNRLTFAMLLVVIILIGAGAGIYTGLRHSAKEASDLFTEPAEIQGFFTTDRSVAVPLASTADELNRAIRAEIVVAPAGITHVYGVTTNEKNNRQLAVATETMVKSLGWRLDSRFLRALEETMMIGSVGNEPYVILRSSNFDLAFAGMLGWESAMPADLATIFEITPRPTEGPFTDVLVQNRNLRVRTDTAGNETIVYTFLDRRTIIISRNQTTLLAIIAAIQ